MPEKPYRDSAPESSGADAPETCPAINYDRLPESLRGGMRRYIEHGIIPGSFLQAVISNDLKESFARADEDNIAAMHQIVRFMYNEVPMNAWGSPEKMKVWHERHALPGGVL